MNLDEIVREVVQGNSRRAILNFAESIREPRILAWKHSPKSVPVDLRLWVAWDRESASAYPQRKLT